MASQTVVWVSSKMYREIFVKLKSEPMLIKVVQVDWHIAPGL